MNNVLMIRPKRNEQTKKGQQKWERFYHDAAFGRVRMIYKAKSST